MCSLMNTIRNHLYFRLIWISKGRFRGKVDAGNGDWLLRATIRTKGHDKPTDGLACLY